MRVLFDRSLVIVLGLLALVLAAGQVRVVFDFVLYAWSGLGAGFAPALILSLFWKRTTGRGVVAGMIVGLVVTVVWRNLPALKAIVYRGVFLFEDGRGENPEEWTRLAAKFPRSFVARYGPSD